jgi:hypothetical protein
MGLSVPTVNHPQIWNFKAQLIVACAEKEKKVMMAKSKKKSKKM